MVKKNEPRATGEPGMLAGSSGETRPRVACLLGWFSFFVDVNSDLPLELIAFGEARATGRHGSESRILHQDGERRGIKRRRRENRNKAEVADRRRKKLMV